MASPSVPTEPQGSAGGLRRLLREPMLHFILAAALIFMVYAVVSPPPPPAQNQITLTAQDADRLKAQFRATWNRDPSDGELRGLVDQFVREEIYYREARDYGLDLNDQVVRVRMRQKMEFLLADPTAVPEPTEADLLALFEATKQKYTTPQTLGFQQVFLGDAAPGTAEAALTALAQGSDPAAVSLPSLLPAGMQDARPSAVDSMFGDGFFARIAELATGSWTGPVRSALGQHLVYVTSVQTSPPPDFGAVRPSVEAEWRRDATRKAAEAAYDRLKSRYTIDLSQTGLTE